MKNLITSLFLGSALAFPVLAEAGTPVSDDAEVFILSPADGATIKGPVHVQMGHKGVEIHAAGTERDNAGHHVLLIDTPMPNLDEDIPSDAHHRHLADGSTDIVIELAPGQHTLQLLLVDHNHAVHDTPVMSEKAITITVVE